MGLGRRPLPANATQVLDYVLQGRLQQVRQASLQRLLCRAARTRAAREPARVQDGPRVGAAMRVPRGACSERQEVPACQRYGRLRRPV